MLFRFAAAFAALLLGQTAFAEPSLGPLRVCQANRRFFADANGKAVCLVGSHTWNNLQDIGLDNPPRAFDFERYLGCLERHGHNFIRMWRWELLSWNAAETPQWTNGSDSYVVAPHPWKRTGPGIARDGLPRFDLQQFDPVYFERLRSRVRAAANRGIYVSIMLFEGWGLQHLREASSAHPFHPDNNVNGIDGDADREGRSIEIHTLQVPAVTQLQEQYVRHLIGCVNEFENVLYEISNETGANSYKWQCHFVEFVKRVEGKAPLQHPVGMTFLQSADRRRRGTNAMLFESPADWISPNPDAPGKYNYRNNPPPADGLKVVVSDTDHLWAIGGNSDWAWKSFCRRHNPIFMDPYDNRILGKDPPETSDDLRQSLGQVRRLADRIGLAKMFPDEQVASTGYCLANPAGEYVVYFPGGGSAEVDLSLGRGTLSAEWIHPVRGDTRPAKPVTGGGRLTFTAPFGGPAVLYLQASTP